VAPRKLLPILVLIIVLLLAALIWFYPATGDFRAGNPFWNGLTTFTVQFKASTTESLSDLPLTPKATALILVPYTQLSEQELEELKSYVSAGGTLIIMDDYGYGNQILSHLKLEMRFAGKPLLDPLFNYRNKWLPRITDFSQSPITSGVKSIVLNHATALYNVSETEALAWSSSFSFLDLDGDSAWDPDEPAGPFPVAAYTKVEEGYVVVVADPSIMINSMMVLDDNAAFIKNIVEVQGKNPKVMIDQSHLPREPLDEAKGTIAAVYALASSQMGTLSLITLTLTLTLIPLWWRKQKVE